MTRDEKRILRDAIRHVAHHNANAWWELKRQIFEGGFHLYYPVQSDFDFSARQAIDRLSPEERERLVAEWSKSHGKSSTLNNEQIWESYARMIEVVAENWTSR